MLIDQHDGTVNILLPYPHILTRSLSYLPEIVQYAIPVDHGVLSCRHRDKEEIKTTQTMLFIPFSHLMAKDTKKILF